MFVGCKVFKYNHNNIYKLFVLCLLLYFDKRTNMYGFTSTGALACIWFIVWMIFVHDTPAQHPRISTEERNYIEKSIGVKQVRK